MMQTVTRWVAIVFFFTFVPLGAEEMSTDKDGAAKFPQLTFTESDRRKFDSALIGMKSASRSGTASTAKVPRFDPKRVDELWKDYIKRAKEAEPYNLAFAEEAAEILDLKKEEIISGPGFSEWREKMNPHGDIRPVVLHSIGLSTFMDNAEAVLGKKGERIRTSEKGKIQKAWSEREKEVSKIIRDFSGDISKNIRFSRTKARKYLFEDVY